MLANIWGSVVVVGKPAPIVRPSILCKLLQFTEKNNIELYIVNSTQQGD